MLSTHTVAVILVRILTIKLESAILTEYADGRMMYAIEHIGLDRCVVNHILENELFTNLQWVVEGPVAHEVATKAAVTTDLRMVWHLEAVRHMACEADVDDGRLDAFVLDDVHDVGHEEPRLPSESRAWLHDELEPRIAVMEVVERTDQ